MVNSDYTLSTVSPALEMGDNSFVVTDYNEDLYGRTRINATVDLGAVEGFYTLSIKNNQITDLKVYPNPTSDLINITTNEEIESLKLLNSLGQVKALNYGQNNLDIRFLSNGIYLLEIKTKSGKKSVQKIIKN